MMHPEGNINYDKWNQDTGHKIFQIWEYVSIEFETWIYYQSTKPRILLKDNMKDSFTLSFNRWLVWWNVFGGWTATHVSSGHQSCHSSTTLPSPSSCHFHHLVITTTLSFPPLCHLHHVAISTTLSSPPLNHLHHFVILTNLSSPPLYHLYHFVISANSSSSPTCQLHHPVISPLYHLHNPAFSTILLYLPPCNLCHLSCHFHHLVIFETLPPLTNFTIPDVNNLNFKA